MKKLIFILLFVPIIVFAAQAQESENIKTFKQLCQNTKDATRREHYCELVKKQKIAEAIIKDFEENKSTT